MLALDASGIVHGWDNYPLAKFPGLWRWIEGEVSEGGLIISVVAYTEVTEVSPDCAVWLDNAGINKSPISSAMLLDTLSYKEALDIADEAFHVNGVDEKDLMIIANAKAQGAILISNEALQNSLPQLKSKYKIPAVCDQVANVVCISFLKYITSADVTF